MSGIKKCFNKIIIILGILLAVACIVMSGRLLTGLSSEGGKESVQVVFLGDSIFGNFRDDSSIPALFSKSAEKTVLNAGLGGTTAAVCGNNPRSEVVQDSLSLVGIAEAIFCGDYSIQRSAIPSRVANGDLTYFDETINDLESTDITGAEIIIIEHGLNDYFNDWPIDGAAGNTNSYTGAMNYAIKLIKSKCPNSTIVLISPVYGRDNLSGYSLAAEMVAKDQNIYFFDAYNAGIVDSSNVDEVTIDGIHLNEIGREIYADKLYDYCKSQGLL